LLPVKEYDIFVPIYYNDGTSVEARKFQDLQEFLLRHFDGLTFFPQPNKGIWRMGKVIYRDEVVIYRVLTENAKRARRVLLRLKESLKTSFRQEEILIITRNVGVL
jgi:hypothetical protein